MKTEAAPFSTTPHLSGNWRLLHDDEKIKNGDAWFDFADKKWWEFTSVNGGRCAAEYLVVVRRISTWKEQ